MLLSLFVLSLLARIAIPGFFKRNLWLLHLNGGSGWNLGESSLFETGRSFEQLRLFLCRCFCLLAACRLVIGFIWLPKRLSWYDYSIFCLFNILGFLENGTCLLSLDLPLLLFYSGCFFFLFGDKRF